MVLQILKFIGGLALLMYGLKAMTDSLQKLAGNSLRKVFGIMTKNRFTGLFTGTFITATVQSSTATTLLTVSFVNVGLLTLNQAISVIMGANIGTTVTAWIMNLGFAFDMSKVVYPMFVIGIVAIYVKKSNVKTLGDFIFGLAFLFFGLVSLKSNAETMDLSHNESVKNFFASTSNMGFATTILYLVIGGILTFMVQSSAAIVAFTQLLCLNGVLPIEQGIALVLGENIGTTITSNISALKAGCQSRRAALAHLMFNLFGVIWVLCIFHPFLNTVAKVWGFGDFNNINPEQLPKYIAAFHTSFNVCNVLILIWFINYMEKIICRIIKEKKEDVEGRLLFINNKLPNLDIDSAVKETDEMSNRVIKMFGFVKDLLKIPLKQDNDFNNLYARIDKYESISDNMEAEISKFLNRMSEAGNLNVEAKQTVRILFREVSEIESIGDSNSNIARAIKRKYEAKEEFTSEQLEHIDQMFKLCDDALHQMKVVLAHPKPIESDTQESYRIEKQINNLRKLLREGNITNIEEHKYNYQCGLFYMDIISACEKLGDYVINVIEAHDKLKLEELN
ncbi:MAG: Na/Pi cotransporter family protein [Bacteroidales bacterium]|nr:Na/Pi cotransporter family protein [Bacteroidales bacterium]